MPEKAEGRGRTGPHPWTWRGSRDSRRPGLPCERQSRRPPPRWSRHTTSSGCEFDGRTLTLLRGLRRFKNNQQGAASPAQLVHDFECLPHVPRVESDGTWPLRSVFFLQRVWTESSAPERDGSQRRTLRTKHVSPVHPQQHAEPKNAPTVHFRVVYLTFVHFSYRNKISVQKEEQTSRAGVSGELTIRSASIPMHVQRQPWHSLSLWRSLCAWPFHCHPFWTFCLILCQTGQAQQVESSIWLQSGM